ncbi:hypothetical protein QWI17_03480 [Gilvimarinus sp. SDUM040013]|uniref:Uncharacterized protein n=1 Tax=Gilvimarinus gilvus TaxID=3058038 RepID=A0ABU4S0J2_9GAMM|nr:hypothetical protein [Gilvimarinus sp. SDUM040013]MDO3384898.1 hypothetical protein [Gilvimarinus sp. SDUM040013]MDX6850677.1 hypothetical protein [Gilvimarinus sp. SDUM040013]
MVAGIGEADYGIAFCIANRPPLDDYSRRRCLVPLLPGELHHIVSNSSNHWRKLFNVYAKFIYSLAPELIVANSSPPTWQEYRDQQLLQAGSRLALLFTAPPWKDDALHIIAGKGYAATLNIPKLQWLDAHFAIAPAQRVIVSPYLDYRQLSNERIERLVKIIRQYSLLSF